MLGADGSRDLATGEVTGDDPLAPFGPDAVDQVSEVDGYRTVADLMVNSRYDPDLDEVAAFEHQVGSHGALGGPQTHPFLLHPDRPQRAPDEPILGSPALHRVLKGWLADLGQPVTTPLAQRRAAASTQPTDTFRQRQVEQPGHGRRFGVLRGEGEEAGRRRWFDHPLDVQPALGQGVDVARQRTVDEADVHAELDLLHRLGLLEVAPDAPVLLGRFDHLVVDPAAVGCLQQRVVEEEAEPPAGREDPGDLGDRRVDLVDVLEHEAGDHRIERSVGERELVRRRPGEQRHRRVYTAALIWFHVGSTPATSSTPSSRAARRLI